MHARHSPKNNTMHAGPAIQPSHATPFGSPNTPAPMIAVMRWPDAVSQLAALVMFVGHWLGVGVGRKAGTGVGVVRAAAAATR